MGRCDGQEDLRPGGFAMSAPFDLEAIRHRTEGTVSVIVEAAKMDDHICPDCLRMLVTDARALIAEVERLGGAMEPDHWFRINTPDGSLWMETSNEEEAGHEAAKTGWPLERLFKSKQVKEWRTMPTHP
jgi:hypothetical protein